MVDPHYLIKPLSFFDTFSRKSGEQKTTHYCPGCGHGIVHKLLAEAIDELGIQDQTIMVGSVGCSVFIYYYFETAAVSAPHGRAPAIATGISRTTPNAITVAYQGDGDLAAIGTSHTIHAANRGEKIIVIFVNNNVYGMTGGQLAPTSLVGQITATTPDGRSLQNEGPPIKMAELIASFSAPVLVARTAVNSPKNVRKCREMIKSGLQAQVEKKGYVFIEILAACPTNWRLTPSESCDWIENVVSKQFPLGIFKNTLENDGSHLRILDQSEENSAEEPHPLSENISLSLVQPPQIAPPSLIVSLENTDVDAPNQIPEKEIRIKCAGFGGQGVLSLGSGLANVAVNHGLEVTWFPSYGPEVRGGVANCSVVIGNSSIGSPIVDVPDLLIAMNKPSLSLFGPKVPENGAIIYNSSMVDEIPPGIVAKLYPVDATNIATAIGQVKVCNSVLLGFAAHLLDIFTLEEVFGFAKSSFPETSTLRKYNISAIEKGWELAENDRLSLQ